MSPPILSHSSHCSPSNKWPLLTLPQPPFSCLCCDAVGLRPAFLKPLCPGSSLLKPGHRLKLQWVCHPPALKHATFIYLFSVLSPPMPAGDISGPRYRVLIGGSARLFSIPSSHSPPARCLGRLEQMFHFGLAGGFKPGLQRSVTSGSHQLSQRGRAAPSPGQSSLSAASKCLPWPVGLLREREEGPGIAQDFYSSSPHQSEGPVLSNCHLDFW